MSGASARKQRAARSKIVLLLRISTFCVLWLEQTIEAFGPGCSQRRTENLLGIQHNHRRQPTRLPSILQEGEAEGSEDVKLKYDMERYRNRSVLLENALKQKLKHLELSDQKLLVLQDAAKRVVRRHEGELAEAAGKAAKEKAESVAITEADRQVGEAVKKVETEWHIKLEEADAKRLKAVEQLESLQQQWKDVNAERDLLASDLTTIQRDYAQDQVAWKAQAQKLEQQLALKQERYEAAVAQIEQLERTAAKTENELLAANSQVDTLQTALQKEQHRISNIKAKFTALAETKENLQVELETLRRENKALAAETFAAVEREQRSTGDDVAFLKSAAREAAVAAEQQQQEYEERMEIAQSAVDAAVRRETAVQQKYDSLLQNFESVLRENRALQQQLAAQQQQTPPAFVKLDKVQTSGLAQPSESSKEAGTNVTLAMAEEVQPIAEVAPSAVAELAGVPRVDGAPLELQAKVTIVESASYVMQDTKQSNTSAADVKPLELQEEVTIVEIASVLVPEAEQSNIPQMLRTTDVTPLEQQKSVTTVVPASHVVQEAKQRGDPAASTAINVKPRPELTSTADTTSRRLPILRKRLRAWMIAILRPGKIGDYFQKRHFTFEADNSSSKWWRFVKRLLPRIPFRIVRITKDEK
jgi:hypothetical protein